MAEGDDKDDKGVNMALAQAMASMEASGVSAITVSDGTVFTFTAERLRTLLDQAIGHEKRAVVVFVKHSVLASA